MVGSKYGVGDDVHKDSGDYTYSGKVVSVYRKANGVLRYVVEDARGLNFIFNESSLKPGAAPARGNLVDNDEVANQIRKIEAALQRVSAGERQFDGLKGALAVLDWIARSGKLPSEVLIEYYDGGPASWVKELRS